jgi:hypothetical protein
MFASPLDRLRVIGSSRIQRPARPPSWPRLEPKLDPATDVAEHLFGFTGDNDKGELFRGLLRFETLWGPETASQETSRIDLAPLTAPASQGKSRPLYLEPGTTGLAASFDDKDIEARGRKFYWHQRTTISGVSTLSRVRVWMRSFAAR